ncbi:MAG: hypothetical protein KBB70_02400 [Candidatus Pacebacteria bacterium]|nr:hypothetical protein [Candidatus Paceibacterota bacterium]
MKKHITILVYALSVLYIASLIELYSKDTSTAVKLFHYSFALYLGLLAASYYLVSTRPHVHPKILLYGCLVFLVLKFLGLLFEVPKGTAYLYVALINFGGYFIAMFLFLPILLFGILKYQIRTGGIRVETFIQNQLIDFEIIMAGLFTETTLVKRIGNNGEQFVCNRNDLAAFGSLCDTMFDCIQKKSYEKLITSIPMNAVGTAFVRCLLNYFNLLAVINRNEEINTSLHDEKAEANYPNDLGKRRWELVADEEKVTKRIQHLQQNGLDFGKQLLAA